ncbi:MAG: ABC transporter permease [SAR202 cluster bacterium]|nr:ABC transporter permease [SAR202 cluster bacterium]
MASRQIAEQLAGIEFLDIDVSITDEALARERLAEGDIEFALIVPEAFRGLQRDGDSIGRSLLYDEANTTSNQIIFGVMSRVVDDVNFLVSGASRVVRLDPATVRSENIEYFDVLLIGLVGMGVMFNSIVAIAVRISAYREQKVLKRLLATPLGVRDYFVAIVAAHLVLALVQTAIILAVGVFVFGATIHGNVVWIFVLVALGNIIFLNIGFAIAAFAKNAAAASGMGNVVAMPMMFFSGTFFPTTLLPWVLPQVVRVLPLTPLLEAMREVAIDGGAPWNAPTALALLGAWMAVSSVVAIRLFKFR